MKKLLCVIGCITLLLTVMSTSVAANEIEFGMLEEIGDIQPDFAEGYSIFKVNRPAGTGINANEEIIGEDGLEFMLKVFSDENLEPIGVVFENEIDGNNEYFPKDSINLEFQDVNRVWWTVCFNDNSVFVEKYDQFTKEPTFIVLQNVYTYKDKTLYDQLMQKIYGWDAKHDEEVKQSVAENQKNKIEIRDFKFIYVGQYSKEPLNFRWGVCSYIREGETEPKVMFFDSHSWTDNTKIIKVTDKFSNNTYTTEIGRLVRIEGEATSGIEYDYYYDSNRIRKLKINVSEKMTAESIMMQTSILNEELGDTYYFDMDSYTETGKLPEKYFSVSNNTQFKNKVQNFTKLYSEELSLYPTGKTEIGICEYYNELSGEVKAFYIAGPYYYYISEITEPLYTSDVKNNDIYFDNSRMIVNGYEVIDGYDEATKYRIGLGFSKSDKSIIYRSFNKKDLGQDNYYNQKITSYKVLSGELEDLEFFAQEIKEDKTEIKETEKIEETEEKTEEIAEEEKNTTTEKEETLPNEDSEEKEQAAESISFIDIPSTHWAYNEVMNFAKNGIVLGYGNGYFGADDYVTYEHFALLLNRLLEYNEDDTQSVPAVREDIIVSVVKALELSVDDADISIIESKFTDCGNLQEKNLKYIAKAVEEGLVIGAYGKLCPEDYLTRAETVVLLSRAIMISSEI